MRIQKFFKGIFLVIGFVVVLNGCQSDKVSSGFTLLSPEESGVDFSNNLIETDSFNIIQYLYFYNGAGVGIGDFNNDGWEDIVLAANQSPPALYMNEASAGRISFLDHSKTSGLSEITGWTTGVSVADINGDGWLDVYLCQLGGYKNQAGRNRVLINQGMDTGRISFKDETEKLGLDFQGFSTQAAFFDFDLDGDLDLYLLNHSVHEPDNYGKSELREVTDAFAGDRIYRNENGIFVDVTSESGIYSSKIGYGLGVAISDVDRDGWPDIYVANDFHEQDYLYINQGNGVFEEVIERVTGHTSQFSMGIDIGDINNDLRPDIMTLDMMPPDEFTRKTSVGGDRYEIAEFKNSFGYHYQLPRNHLQVNLGNDEGLPQFIDLAQLEGIESTDWSWAVLMADFDNNGLKDLFISNGIPRRPNDLDYLNYIANLLVQRNASDLEIASQMPSGRTANVVFSQPTTLHFEDLSAEWGIDLPSISNGAAYGDLDNDGDLDLVVNNINDPVVIYRNELEYSDERNDVKISLKGNGANTTGIGSRITAFSGDMVQYYEQFPIKGFMSSSTHKVHFGTGSGSGFDSIVVEWPEGQRSVVVNVAKGTDLVVSQSNITTKTAESSDQLRPFKSSSAIVYTHTEDAFNDLEREKLLPWLFSREGPGIATGDVNGDQLIDLFVGGASGQPAVLFLQSKEGLFNSVHDKFWVGESVYEDVDAEFVDIDGDGDKDLVVASGGNHRETGSPFYRDRLYRNDGNGNFVRDPNALPAMATNSSCLTAADFDIDGDQDLFVGQRNGNYYGARTSGLVLINDGNGNFTTNIELTGLGMVTDASWSDLNSDGRPDLVVSGEWMPITIFMNEKRGLVKREVDGTKGIWMTLLVDDVDQDGDPDILAGNFGLNHNLTKHVQRLRLYIEDFDMNGSVDPVITYWNHEEYPITSKDELAGQINSLKKSFPVYKEFARKTIDEIFEPAVLEKCERYEIETMESLWLENIEDGTFAINGLPKVIQSAPVTSIVRLELIPGETSYVFAGNKRDIIPRIGRQTASRGTLISYSGNEWETTENDRTGLFLKGQVSEMVTIKVNVDKSLLIAGSNNAPVQVYSFMPDFDLQQ